MSAAAASRLRAHRAHVTAAEPGEALAQLASELEADAASAVLLFCSNSYDLERLGRGIADTFKAPVAACTSSGQIGGGGFERGGITGVSLQGSDLTMRPLLLSPLSLCQSQAQSIAREHAKRVAAQPGLRSFGVLMVDGFSMWEEFVAAALYQALGNVTVVGGSAASDTPDRRPAVYHDGRFLQGAGVLALFETRQVPFATFVAQHFVPSSKKLVITLADPERRTVYEINGEPAARAYARALGVSASELTHAHFAAYPLMLDLGEQLLPRAIRARNDDGSLLLACAIEEGLVVSIADSKDPLLTLDAALKDVTARVPDPATLLVFDCIARRTELEGRGLADAAGKLLADYGAVGFSSYGEQLGPIHTNHTLTGLALGRASAEGPY
ncbi:MAG TPA: FIST N-terminal domain-containing protein [Polyangiaceae bacterium]|nr:FIST N-terminal domain-containing protein [Polyangiaceae bacterium]